MSRRMKHALTLLALAALTGCAGPEPQRPSASEAAHAAVPERLGASDTATTDLRPWAQSFRGERLQGLITLALAHNRDLRIAALNVEAAQATERARAADLWPTVSAGLTGSRQPTASGGINSLYTAGLQVSSYELDVFGRLRGLDAAAAAQVLAADAAQQTVRTALVASVVSADIALRSDAALLALVQATLASREASQALVQQRFERGIANELDLRSAESATQATRVALAQVRRQQALDQHALALLLGQALPAEAPARDDDFAPLDELPAGLPSEVLLQRPDVRQAEAQLRAADANIDAARAAFFPRITLTASAGTASGALNGLFKHSAWSFAPQLVQPLFDAGRNRANLAAARATRDIALAQYEKAIQSAFREVADALSSRAELATQREAQAAQVAAESRRLALAQARFDAGVAGSLEVLDAQRSLFGAQQALVQVQAAQAANLVTLYRALGGGVR